MKTYILYHAGCWDGLAAAWVVKNCLRTDIVDFIPVQYDQPLPELEPNSTLYILDFCYPLEIMQKLFETMKYITVIDHHKTAADTLKSLMDQKKRGTFKFDISKSGCRLAWEFYLKDKQSPGIIDYIEDRDLWAWKLPGSKEVNACLRSYPTTFETLDKYSRLTYQQLYMEMFPSGEAILRREKQIIDTHVGFAVKTKIAGYDILAVNATVLISEIAGELAKDRPFGACYFREKSGKIVWSLRSDENGVDVSEIAKKFGGGGHKHAAGFSVIADAVEAVVESAEEFVPKVDLAIQQLIEETNV